MNFTELKKVFQANFADMTKNKGNQSLQNMPIEELQALLASMS